MTNYVTVGNFEWCVILHIAWLDLYDLSFYKLAWAPALTVGTVTSSEFLFSSFSLPLFTWQRSTTSLCQRTWRTTASSAVQASSIDPRTSSRGRWLLPATNSFGEHHLANIINIKLLRGCSCQRETDNLRFVSLHFGGLQGVYSLLK